jgi:hypothetical protein
MGSAPMKRKLIAFAATLVILGGLKIALVRPSGAAAPPLSALLPETIGKFKLVRRWKNTTGFGTEAGADYSDGNGSPVSFDVRPDAVMHHNTVGCFLVRGEKPRDERVGPVTTARGAVEFDVAMFEERDGFSLVAATECYAGACVESRRSDAWEAPQLNFAAAGGFVPVSIEITDRPVPAESRATAQARLMERFETFAAALDLGTIQQAAGAGGASQ